MWSLDREAIGRNTGSPKEDTGNFRSMVQRHTHCRSFLTGLPGQAQRLPPFPAEEEIDHCPAVVTTSVDKLTSQLHLRTSTRNSKPNLLELFLAPLVRLRPVFKSCSIG